jgi:hypothetical protein
MDRVSPEPDSTVTRQTLARLSLIGAMAVALAWALVTLWLFHPTPYTWDGYCYPGNPGFSWTQGALGWIGSALVFTPCVVMMVRGASRTWIGLLVAGGVCLIVWVGSVIALWEPTGSIAMKPNC